MDKINPIVETIRAVWKKPAFIEKSYQVIKTDSNTVENRTYLYDHNGRLVRVEVRGQNLNRVV